MKLKKLDYLSPWVLTLCFFAYTILSWIVLFRDKRALEGISFFYPELQTFLFTTRNILLENNLNTIPTFLFGLISVLAIYFYIRSLAVKISLKKTILFGGMFAVIAFIAYPVLSTDIFSYMFSERVSTVHHESIWKTTPASFPNDPFYKIADWKDTTSVYGGVHYLLYLPLSLIGGNSLLVLTILYKIIPAVFAIGSGWILYLLLKAYKPDFLESGLRLVFWNPLFVLEIFGSGHNDSIMIFFALLSYLFYQRKQWLFAGIALALSVHVKLIPIILLFFFAITLLKQKYVKRFILLLVGFISTNAVLFFFMQINPIEFVQRALYNGGVYWQSLPNLLRYYVESANTVILFAFLLWLIFFIQSYWQKQTNPTIGYVWVLLIYLLFVSAAYWNWYVLWILPFILFTGDKKLVVTTLVFSFTSLLAYPLLWLSLRFGFGSFIWPIITYLFVFGIPIMVYIGLREKKSYLNKAFKKVGVHNLIADKPVNSV